MKYPDVIQKAVKVLCDELEKIIPGITNRKYQKSGDDWTFRERMEMSLVMELMFAGEMRNLEDKQ